MDLVITTSILYRLPFCISTRYILYRLLVKGGGMNCLTRIIYNTQGRILVDLIDKIILFRMNLSSQNTNQSKAEINIYVQIISTFAIFHRNVYVSVSYKRHKWYVRIYRPAFEGIAFYKIKFGMRAIVANIIKKSGDYL